MYRMPATVCVCVTLIKSLFKFILGVWGIAGTGLAMQMHAVFWVLHTFTHSFTLSYFNIIWAIPDIFEAISTGWVSKSMSLSQEIHCTYFNKLSHIPSHTHNFHAFGIFEPVFEPSSMLGIKLHIHELINSLMALAIGLQKGQKGQKSQRPP